MLELSSTAVTAQLLFVLVLWAVYLGTELWKSQNERCTPGYFMAYGTQAGPVLARTHQHARCQQELWSLRQCTASHTVVHLEAVGSFCALTHAPPICLRCYCNSLTHCHAPGSSGFFLCADAATNLPAFPMQVTPPTGGGAAGSDCGHDVPQGAQDGAPPAAHGPGAGRHPAQQRQRCMLASP